LNLKQVAKGLTIVIQDVFGGILTRDLDELLLNREIQAIASPPGPLILNKIGT
jgi:hypothetical protein